MAYKQEKIEKDNTSILPNQGQDLGLWEQNFNSELYQPSPPKGWELHI